MSSEDDRFVSRVRSHPDFREELASAASMSESLRIAREHGFRVDAAVVRSALSGDRHAEDLDDADLDEVLGGADSGSDW